MINIQNLKRTGNIHVHMYLQWPHSILMHAFFVLSDEGWKVNYAASEKNNRWQFHFSTHLINNLSSSRYYVVLAWFAVWNYKLFLIISFSSMPPLYWGIFLSTHLIVPTLDINLFYFIFNFPFVTLQWQQYITLQYITLHYITIQCNFDAAFDSLEGIATCEESIVF